MDFLMALGPMLIVLIGMLALNRSGFVMSIVGWITAVLIAWLYFKTPLSVVFGASLYGIVKAFAITIAVAFTMLMIFIMQEAGALAKIVKTIKSITKDKVQQTLLMGMGFGSLATSLGVVTPALFPPVFMMLGFAPISAVAISVLCYDPLTSFALLSIPITLSSHVAWGPFGIRPPGIANAQEFIWAFTQHITYFLPVVSVGFALMMLFFVDGWNAIRKNWLQAVIAGLVLSLTALVLAYTRAVPVEVIGIISGFLTMLVAYWLYRHSTDEKIILDKDFFLAVSPWLLLFLFSFVTNHHILHKILAGLGGKFEVLPIVANKKIDLDIFAHVYFWILVSIVVSLPLIKPSKEQLNRAFSVWIKRVFGPFTAYSLFFAVAFIMAWSGMDIIGGKLVPSVNFKMLNMDIIIGQTFASIFGSFYPLVSPFLGLIGAFVGGSETASNVLFAKIQYSAVAATIGVTSYMATYSAHAVAGGIASAITPSKITNAAALIGLKGKDESKLLRTLIWPVLTLTLFVGIMLQIIVLFVK
jgi:lactate permease